MNRGEKLLVQTDGAWLPATYEFRCTDQEPLGHHSVMLVNGGGRRVVCGCKTLLPNEPVPTERLPENERLMLAEINRLNGELSSVTEFVSECVLRNYYLYSGYQVKSRGPVGIMHSILRRTFPAAQQRIAEGEHPDAVYTDCFGDQRAAAELSTTEQVLPSDPVHVDPAEATGDVTDAEIAAVEQLALDALAALHTSGGSTAPVVRWFQWKDNRGVWIFLELLRRANERDALEAALADATRHSPVNIGAIQDRFHAVNFVRAGLPLEHASLALLVSRRILEDFETELSTIDQGLIDSMRRAYGAAHARNVKLAEERNALREELKAAEGAVDAAKHQELAARASLEELESRTIDLELQLRQAYTATDIHGLIEQAASGHDKLALDHRNTTAQIKAEALRRWADTFVPLAPAPAPVEQP